MLEKISLTLYMTAALFIILFIFFRGEMPIIMVDNFLYIILGLVVSIGIIALLKMSTRKRR